MWSSAPFVDVFYRAYLPRVVSLVSPTVRQDRCIMLV